jgi:hypothetical protein
MIKFNLIKLCVTFSGHKVKKINLDLRNFKRKNFEGIENWGTFVVQLQK